MVESQTCDMCFRYIEVNPVGLEKLCTDCLIMSAISEVDECGREIRAAMQTTNLEKDKR